MTPLPITAIPRRRATSIADVRDQLAALDRALRGTTLEPLRAFNHAYFLTTQAVLNRLRTAGFGHPELLTNVDSFFAQAYTKPLRAFLVGRRIPTAWRICFETAQSSQTFMFIVLALGVNAHVNHDLPRVLATVVPDDKFKTDYDSINELFPLILDDVIAALHEPDPTLDAAEHAFKHEYEFLLKELIASWRQTAWVQSRALRAQTLPKRSVTARATRIARLLASVNQLAKHKTDLLAS